MNDILNELCDTQIYSIFKQMESFYQKIQIAQADWYKKMQLYCPEGCGECCRNFELDLLECEAVYMAVWLMQNQRETAQKVMDGNFPFNQNKVCPSLNSPSKTRSDPACLELRSVPVLYITQGFIFFKR